MFAAICPATANKNKKRSPQSVSHFIHPPTCRGLGTGLEIPWGQSAKCTSHIFTDKVIIKDKLLSKDVKSPSKLCNGNWIPNERPTDILSHPRPVPKNAIQLWDVSRRVARSGEFVLRYFPAVANGKEIPSPVKSQPFN